MAGLNESENGFNFSEVRAAEEGTGTGTGQSGTGEKRKHVATGNPKGRPRKDGKPAGSPAAAAAGRDQSTEAAHQDNPQPVLITKKDPVKKPVKKAAKKSSKKDTDLVAGQMAFFIQGIFGLVASRSGEHWYISDMEAQNVAEPAARILDRMEISETVAAYSDYAALALATGAIIIPRVIHGNQIKAARQPQQPQPVKGGTGNVVRIVNGPKQANTEHQQDNTDPGPAVTGARPFADIVAEIIDG